jgi:cholesterol transport system auxiliary component
MKRAWALLLIAAGGCVDLKAEYPDRRYYTIESERNGAERPGSPASVLRVRRFSASKMCDGNELVRRTGEAVYESDFYNILFMTPAQQVGEQTQRWLSASKLYGHVVGTGSSILETHTLEGNVVTLHGDFRKPLAPMAVIEIQFMLVRTSTDPPAPLFQRNYRKELPLPGGDPAALVKGWSEGLARILAALEEDLARVK